MLLPHCPGQIKTQYLQVVTFAIKKNKLVSFIEMSPFQGTRHLGRYDLTSVAIKTF